MFVQWDSHLTPANIQNKCFSERSHFMFCFMASHARTSFFSKFSFSRFVTENPLPEWTDRGFYIVKNVPGKKSLQNHSAAPLYLIPWNPCNEKGNGSSNERAFSFPVTSIQIFEVERAGMAMQFPFFLRPLYI